MNKKEIDRIIAEHGDDWYYYYNFDGSEVKSKLKNDKTAGICNWDKLKPIMQDLFDEFNGPCVFNIGCNMALYDHEMYKMGATSVGIDRKDEIEQAEFYRKYVTENLGEKWGAELIIGDMQFYNMIHYDVDIITLFCVMYHLRPNPEFIFNKFKKLFPNHKYVMLQGNVLRVKKKGQSIAGKDGMIDFLKKKNYEIYRVEEWNGYQKPVVVGVRKNNG